MEPTAILGLFLINFDMDGIQYSDFTHNIELVICFWIFHSLFLSKDNIFHYGSTKIDL